MTSRNYFGPGDRKKLGIERERERLKEDEEARKRMLAKKGFSANKTIDTILFGAVPLATREQCQDMIENALFEGGIKETKYVFNIVTSPKDPFIVMIYLFFEDPKIRALFLSPESIDMPDPDWVAPKKSETKTNSWFDMVEEAEAEECPIIRVKQNPPIGRLSFTWTEEQLKRAQELRPEISTSLVQAVFFKVCETPVPDSDKFFSNIVTMRAPIGVEPDVIKNHFSTFSSSTNKSFPQYTISRGGWCEIVFDPKTEDSIIAMALSRSLILAGKEIYVSYKQKDKSPYSSSSSYTPSYGSQRGGSSSEGRRRDYSHPRSSGDLPYKGPSSQGRYRK